MTNIESYIIVRYGEISLKGNNRPIFIAQQVKNIKECLEKYALIHESISTSRGRIIIKTGKILTYKDYSTYNILKTVFGIQDIGSAWKVLPAQDALKECLQVIIPQLPKFTTFRITTKRLDKSVAFTSMELDKEIGAYVSSIYNKKVSLKNPDLNLEIETTTEAWYVITARYAGFSGFPTHSQGTIGVYITDEKGVLTALLMLKTGCKIIPFVNRRANVDLTLLEAYCYGFKLKPMMIDDEKEIDLIGQKYNLQAISTSQGCNEIKQVSTLVNLRPLIAFTEEQQQEKLAEFKHASIY